MEPECAAELKEVRRSLLEDYQISPVIEGRCETDVRSHCAGVVRRDVIHCLMNVARHQMKAAAEAGPNDAYKQLTDGCYHEVCLYH